jgi:hypothetical protein
VVVRFEEPEGSSGLLIVRCFVSKPLVARQSHPVFGIDSQTVGDAIDVVEVADHLRGDRDLVVVEAVRTQSFDVGLLHRSWVQSQLNGEVAKLAIRLG